jgi:hypothetical protein
MDRRFEGWSGRRGARRSAVLLACVGVALTLGLVASFAGSAPSFAGPRNYPTGVDPWSIAIGDLNGDGKPDLATANLTADGVSVLINAGDGGLRTRRDYATGAGPLSIAIGDVNGDGKPDLATANSSANTSSVLLNRGDASFQTKRDYATGAGPLSIAIGDVNGDGKPDLTTANNGAGTVSVLANAGEGSFHPRRNYRTGERPVSIAIGDLNGDGEPDLATANGYADGTVSVLVNRGDGSFQPKLNYRTGRRPESVAIGDLNGDGKPDLATANKAVGTVSVFVNTPGLCTVQDVKRQRQTLPAARRALLRANCRVGKIRRAYSRATRGRVISQKPGFGAVLPGGGKVNLVVSRGRRP